MRRSWNRACLSLAVFGGLALTISVAAFAVTCTSAKPDSCLKGTGTPCSQYAGVTCGSTQALQEAHGQPDSWLGCPDDSSYFMHTSFKAYPLMGNWYKCQGMGSGTGACGEIMTQCMNIDIYKSSDVAGNCVGYCGSQTWLDCSANLSPGPVCP